MLSYQAQEGTDRGSGLCHPQGPPQQPAPSCPRDTPSLAPPSSLQAHPTRSLPALLRQGATPAVGLETAFNGALGAICLAPLLPSHLPTLVPPRASSTPPRPCRCGGHPRALRLLATRLPQSDEGKETAWGWGSAAGPAVNSRLAVVLGCRWPCLSRGGWTRLVLASLSQSAILGLGFPTRSRGWEAASAQQQDAQSPGGPALGGCTASWYPQQA